MMVNKTWKRFSNAGAWFLLTLVSRISGFLRSVLVARFLDPQTASLGFIAISLAEGVRSLGEMGTAQIVVTRPEVGDRELGSAWWVEIGKFTLSTLVLVVLSFSGTWMFPQLDSLIFLSAASITLVRIGTNPVLFLWERNQEMRFYLKVTSIASGVGLIATGFLLALTGSWLALPLGVAVTSLVVTLASNVVGLSPKVLLKAESTTTWQFVREGVPYVAAGVAAYVSNLGLDLVLAFQGLSQEVAPYRLTAALSFASIYVLPASLARASVAADAAYRGESPAAQSQALLFSTSIAALATVSALVVLAPIAGLLYGSTWRAPVGALMGPMCILVGIRALAAPFGGLLIARGAHRSENVFRLTESLIG
ncbi:MAG: oligosaccharide flippase family protein, partial [Myxococcota bacterium]